MRQQIEVLRAQLAEVKRQIRLLKRGRYSCRPRRA